MARHEGSRAPRPSVVTLPRLEPPPALLDFLARRFPRVGRETWRRRIAAGAVRWETGEAVRLDAPYRPGARLLYFREVGREPVVPWAEEIVYRDEHLLAADKPPFLPVVPGGPWVNECLLYRLLRRTGDADLAPLHRLDRHAAGLVLFSRRAGSRARYGALFQAGAIEREYRALAAVAEEPARRSWTVASRIVPGEPWFRMQEVAGEPNSRTRIELLQRQEGIGLFRLRPASGKKHQLRLHMARLGYPILGDPYYPALSPPAPDDFGRPLALLAARLSFRDPVAGARRTLDSGRSLTLAAAGGEERSGG